MNYLFGLLSFACFIMLIIGLFNPQISLFWLKITRTKGKSCIIYLVGMLLFSFIGNCFSKNKVELPKEQTPQTVVETPKAAELNQNVCKCSANMIDNHGSNIYINVVGFDIKNKDCFQYLKDFATSHSAAIHGAATIHFLDNLPSFKAPSNGLYGSDAIQKKVILQYVHLPAGTDIVSFDPLGFGKYVEP